MVTDKETRGSTVAFLAQINSAYLLKRHDFYYFNNIIGIFVIVKWKLLTKLKKLITKRIKPSVVFTSF